MRESVWEITEFPFTELLEHACKGSDAMLGTPLSKSEGRGALSMNG